MKRSRSPRTASAGGAPRDLLTAAALTPAGWEWSVLRRHKDGIEVVRRGRADAPAPDAAAAPALPAEASSWSGPLLLALPAERALLRVADLPADDPQEVRGMAALQADRWAPFPEDDAVAAHETLARRDGATRVLIAALPRRAVEGWFEAAKKAGRPLLRLDLELALWRRQVAAAGGFGAEGREVHLRIAPGAVGVAVTQNGEPIALQHAGASWADAREDLPYLLTSLEAEWGAARIARVRLWTDDPAAVDGDELARAVGGAADHAGPADPGGSLSETFGRGVLENEAAGLDLAPPEWEQARQSRQANRRLARIAAAVIGIWLAGVGGFLGTLAWRQAGNKALLRRIADTEKPADAVRQLETKVREFEAYADRRRSALEALRAAVVSLPPGVTLNSISYRKGKALNLRGEADSANPIYDLCGALQKTDLFTEVKPEGVTSRMSQGRARTEFKVLAAFPEAATP